jgi:hypothetical protein
MVSVDLVFSERQKLLQLVLDAPKEHVDSPISLEDDTSEGLNHMVTTEWKELGKHGRYSAPQSHIAPDQ